MEEIEFKIFNDLGWTLQKLPIYIEGTENLGVFTKARILPIFTTENSGSVLPLVFTLLCVKNFAWKFKV